MSDHRVLFGDALTVLRTLPAESVDCCITSPPYWGLRDYGVEGQIGLEATPEEYVARLVEVFGEVRRVLKPAGTLWLNLGDSYAQGEVRHRQGDSGSTLRDGNCKAEEPWASATAQTGRRLQHGLKPKDLVGVPWRVAFALQADGWWLRNDIVWAKPNAMPESVTDRFSSKHESVFLLSKAKSYWFDLDAVREEHAPQTLTKDRSKEGRRRHLQNAGKGGDDVARHYFDEEHCLHPLGKNPGDVWRMTREEWHEWLDAQLAEDGDLWTLPTQATPYAHFATFPLALAERCLLAGCPPLVCSECGRAHEHRVERTEKIVGDGRKAPRTESREVRPGSQETVDGIVTTAGDMVWATEDLGYHPACECANAGTVPGLVLDPFAGSGTVAQAARKHNRRSLGIELNREYEKVMRQRLGCDGMFADVEFEEALAGV